jgi:hypothetical protein
VLGEMKDTQRRARLSNLSWLAADDGMPAD